MSMKERGCFFYGCVSVLVIAAVLVVGSVLLYFGVKTYYDRAVEQWTAEAPESIPAVKASPGEIRNAESRVREFVGKVQRGESVGPLSLTQDELNMLLQSPQVPEFLRGNAYVRLEDGGAKVEGSIPLASLAPLKSLEGRYLNAQVTLSVSLEQGNLFVGLEDAVVKGIPMSDDVKKDFEGQNLAEELLKQPRMAPFVTFLESLDSLNLEDGAVELVPGQ